MNICIIGDFTGNKDEGYKNITFNISENLSNFHNVYNLNIKKVYSYKFWKKIIFSPKPQIIHIISSPSLSSIFILRLIKLRWYNYPKTVVSAVHPYHISLFSKSIIKAIVKFIIPDLILVQTEQSKLIFKNIGCKTFYFPNGVDTNKFSPVDIDEKNNLRKKHHINLDKFVILHVGHLKKCRNIQIFNHIVNHENILIALVLSEYIEIDEKIIKNKSDEIDYKIFKGFINNIEEIYKLADMYVFPVEKDCTILMPLSILEAMSCNLLTITNDFNGLKEFITEGDGLFYSKSSENMLDLINNLINKKTFPIRNRNKIFNYSWEKLVLNLNEIYLELIKE